MRQITPSAALDGTPAAAKDALRVSAAGACGRAAVWRLTARTGSSTANCPGSISTSACWRKPKQPAIHCWSGCASCRSAPPTSMNSIRCASPRWSARRSRALQSPRPTDARRRSSLSRSRLRAERLLANQQRVWRELRALLNEAGLVVVRHRRAVGRRQGLAGRMVHGAGVPGGDPAGDRPGASVPVHPELRPGAWPCFWCARKTAWACAACCRCQARSSASSACRLSRARRSASSCSRI